MPLIVAFLITALTAYGSTASFCNSTACRLLLNRDGCASLSQCGQCLPFYSSLFSASPSPPTAAGNSVCSVRCNVNSSYCASLNRLPCHSGADMGFCSNCINYDYVSSTDGPGNSACVKRKDGDPILAQAEQGVLKLNYDCTVALQNEDGFLLQIIQDLASSSSPPINPGSISILQFTCPSTVTLVVAPNYNTSYITPAVFMNQMMSQINNPGSALLSGVITSQAASLTSQPVMYQYCGGQVWAPQNQCPVSASGIPLVYGFGVGGALVLLTLLYITYKQCTGTPPKEEEDNAIPLQDIKPQLRPPARHSGSAHPQFKEKHPSQLLKTKKSFRDTDNKVHLHAPQLPLPRSSASPSPSSPSSPSLSPSPTPSKPPTTSLQASPAPAGSFATTTSLPTTQGVPEEKASSLEEKMVSSSIGADEAEAGGGADDAHVDVDADAEADPSATVFTAPDPLLSTELQTFSTPDPLLAPEITLSIVTPTRRLPRMDGYVSPPPLSPGSDVKELDRSEHSALW